MLTAFTLFGTEVDGLRLVILYSLAAKEARKTQDMCQRRVNNFTSVSFQDHCSNANAKLDGCLFFQQVS